MCISEREGREGRRGNLGGKNEKDRGGSLSLCEIFWLPPQSFAALLLPPTALPSLSLSLWYLGDGNDLGFSQLFV